MDKIEFKKLLKTIDDEISAYEELKPLFEEKKELLKKSKSGDLVEVDNKIIAQNERIVKLNKVRQNVSMEYLNKDCSMSDYIELLGVENDDYKEQLMLRKVKICNILEELALLNNQNMELLKHGITITNKMLDTIVDAFAPQGSNYNETGKTDTHDLNMWTVNEEI
jgi:flagellar biosynthesis/type III secretory pathway chaperone